MYKLIRVYCRDVKDKKSIDLLCVGLDHDITVDEDGTNDGDGEERMREDVDGDAADRMERRQQVHGLLGREPEYRPALGHHDERLLVRVVRVDVADRRRGELQGELAVAPGDVVPCRVSMHTNLIRLALLHATYLARALGSAPALHRQHQNQNPAHKAYAPELSLQTPAKKRRTVNGNL